MCVPGEDAGTPAWSRYRGYRLTGQYPNGGTSVARRMPVCVCMVRGMPRIAEAERPARRQRLIDAAWRCLARGSYADLRVEDVCAEAGLSKGSFYGYFETKQDLFYTLVDDDARMLEEAALAGPAQPSNASEMLSGFARVSLRAAEDPARVQLRADIWAAAAQDEALRERLREAIG